MAESKTPPQHTVAADDIEHQAGNRWADEPAGAFYGVPMAVQPMKAAAAAVLIEPMDPAAIAGAGPVIGAVFLILGITGVVSRLARALPSSVAAGLLLGLGLSLAALGIRLSETQIWLGVAISALMLGLMRYQRLPVALVAVLVGIGVGRVPGIAPPFPTPDFGLYLPHVEVPTWAHELPDEPDPSS